MPYQWPSSAQRSVNRTVAPGASAVVGKSATNIPMPVSRASVSTDVRQSSALQRTVAGLAPSVLSVRPAWQARHLWFTRHEACAA